MSAPYLELFSGTQEVSTTMISLAGGQGVIPAFTPLQVEPLTGLFVVWDGSASGTAVYLTAGNIDTAVQTNTQVYKSGTFNTDVINWPVVDDGAGGQIPLTLTQKLAAFAGNCVSAQPLG